MSLSKYLPGMMKIKLTLIRKLEKYTITIKGKLEAWSFNNAGDKDKILKVDSLGNLGWKNLKGAFYGCQNLSFVGKGDFSDVTDMSGHVS